MIGHAHPGLSMVKGLDLKPIAGFRPAGDDAATPLPGGRELLPADLRMTGHDWRPLTRSDFQRQRKAPEADGRTGLVIPPGMRHQP